MQQTYTKKCIVRNYIVIEQYEIASYIIKLMWEEFKMRKNLRRALAIGLVSTMTMGTVVGCSSNKGNDNGGTQANAENVQNKKEYNGIDVSEHVDLTMYLLGEKTPDFDEVYGEINKILEEKLNATVNVEFLSWGEHDTKYSLLFSSEEKFDLIFTASNWAHYEETVSLGGFQELTEDFIKQYAPGIWDAVPEVAWSQAKIDGKVYMVPNYQTEFDQDILAVRGDLLEKYNMDGISSWEELKEFYYKVAENEDGIYASNEGPWYRYFQSQGYSVTGGTPRGGELFLYNTQDPDDLEFQYILDWDGFTEYCKEAKKMADAGCWSPDVLNSTDERQVPFLNGKSATMTWNIGSCRTYAKEANAANPDWKATLVDPIEENTKKVKPYTGNGVAINVNSENKERAMMVLNEFYSNPDVYDLSMLGIEGKHWEAVGEDQYKELDESGFGVDQNCNWGWKNDNINRKEVIENPTTVDEEYEAMDKLWRENIKEEHPYDGFNFDATKVTTQVAAVEAAVGTYYNPLINGLVDDVDSSIEQLKKALENAGINQILDELNRQAEEYIAQR